jgi:hypothetical protein
MDSAEITALAAAVTAGLVAGGAIVVTFVNYRLAKVKLETDAVADLIKGLRDDLSAARLDLSGTRTDLGAARSDLGASRAENRELRDVCADLLYQLKGGKGRQEEKVANGDAAVIQKAEQVLDKLTQKEK